MMANLIELKKHKALALTLQNMQMVNELSGSHVFKNMELNQEEREINFDPAGSHSVAIEIAASLCQLFNLTIHTYTDGRNVKYTLLG